MRHVRVDDPPMGARHLARARQRFEVLRLLLGVLLVLVVLASLVLVIFLGLDIRNQGDRLEQLAKDNQRQAAQVGLLLERQEAAALLNSQQRTAAVKAIAAEQRRQLVAHDERVEVLLRRTLGLVNAEVNNPANRERRPVVILGPTTAPTAAPAPFIGPRCTNNGKKCR